MTNANPGPRTGPLQGVRVLEFPAIGPAPFAGALLADMGADVLRLDRVEPIDLGTPVPSRFDFYNRNKRSLAVDLKQPQGRDAVLRLVEGMDILIEGFRPGVAERLGLGPEPCLARRPSLVYGRMTGWGQHGPLAHEAGHDINYLALSGALHCIGEAGRAPVPPLNLAADLGGGAMYLAVGVLAALTQARASGRGQVVDAGMIDGVAHLMSAFLAFRQLGSWSLGRQENIVDGGAPYYGTYATADGKYVAVGAMEARFYANLLRCMGLDPAGLPDQHDRAAWPRLCEVFAGVFRARTRDAWVRACAGQEACLTPVLDMDEAVAHPHMQARGVFRDVQGALQPAPAPRFSDTPGSLYREPPEAGSHSLEVLAECGFSAQEIATLQHSGAVRQAATP